MISDFFQDFQALIGKLFVLLIVQGPLGLIILLIFANLPNWISHQHYIYSKHKNAGEHTQYWKIDFINWIKERKSINLIIVFAYLIYWLFAADQAVAYVSTVSK